VRIVAGLCWYDEPSAFLERCVASLAGVVDEVVAVDGAWRWFPGGLALSPPDQEEALRRTAREHDLPLRVVVPESVYESQVTKRAHMMELAGENADWVLVIDADEYVARCHAGRVRAGLEATGDLIGIV
jgi:hypothetical protein